MKDIRCVNVTTAAFGYRVCGLQKTTDIFCRMAKAGK
jgi:hypothetical protein